MMNNTNQCYLEYICIIHIRILPACMLFGKKDRHMITFLFIWKDTDVLTHMDAHIPDFPAAQVWIISYVQD